MTKILLTYKIKDLYQWIKTFGATAARRNNLYLLPTPYDYTLHHLSLPIHPFHSTYCFFKVESRCPIGSTTFLLMDLT